MIWKKYLGSLLLALLLGGPGSLLATKVKIRITDHEGQAIAGAETRLVGSQPGEELFGLSSDVGEVEFEVTLPGTHKLMIRKPGFLPLVSSDVQVGDTAVSVEPRLVTKTVLDKWAKDAEEAVKKKKYKEAAEVYRQVLVCFPQDAGFWANLATSYRMDNDMDKAMEAIEKAARYDPQFQGLEKEIVGIATHEAGKRYLAQKEFSKALASFSRSVKADPTYAPAFYGLALSYANQGMYPQALESVQKAIELAPNESQYKSIEEKLKQAVGSK